MEEKNSSMLTEQAKHITIVDYLEKDKIKKGFIKNVNNILNDGEVENISLENVELLKNVFNDKRIQDTFYNGFKNNFSLFYNDDLLMKSQDFVYQLNLLINYSLIPYYENNDVYFLVNKIKNLYSNSDLDLYSAVSYDDHDKELIDEFNQIIKEKEFDI